MRNLLGPGSIVGYCTNVHPARGYDELLTNLERYTLAVKQRVSTHDPMGVGLWFPRDVASELIEGDRVGELADWLGRHDLIPFTFNGFPYGDFHQDRVKKDVYEPAWDDPKRLRYTLDLVTILAGLLACSDGSSQIEGSISTLPVGWGQAVRSGDVDLDQAAANLLGVVDVLEEHERKTGQLIHLDLEPEPGCVLERCGDVTGFFVSHLDPIGDRDRNRRYLRVCYDICHGAVMFEDPLGAFKHYDEAGIKIGKVQVSSAVLVPCIFTELDVFDEAIGQLGLFAEDRYLHQTVCFDTKNGYKRNFFEDLPDALRAYRDGEIPPGQWRVHFHVPIHLDQIGHLRAAGPGRIRSCLKLLSRRNDVTQFEIETYAWDVLPDALRPDDLAVGIAQEMAWLRDQAGSI